MVLLDDDLLACLSKLLFVKSVSLVVFLYCFCVACMDIGRGEAYVGVLVSFFCCWLLSCFLDVRDRTSVGHLVLFWKVGLPERRGACGALA